MQNWSGCSSLSQHQIVTLTDSRDNNTYTVAKLKDGKCWMTQNMRIINRTLTPDLTQTSLTYTLPSSSNAAFSSSIASVYYDSEYGVYYNWVAATTGGNPNDNKVTANSICPKGWFLPSRNEYMNLVSYYNTTSLRQSPVNFQLTGQYYGGSKAFHNKDVNAYYFTNNPESGNGQTFAFGPNCSPIVHGSAAACNGGGGFDVGQTVRCILH